MRTIETPKGRPVKVTGMWGVWEGQKLVARAESEKAAEALADTVRRFGTRERVTVHYLG